MKKFSLGKPEVVIAEIGTETFCVVWPLAKVKLPQAGV